MGFYIESLTMSRLLTDPSHQTSSLTDSKFITVMARKAPHTQQRSSRRLAGLGTDEISHCGEYTHRSRMGANGSKYCMFVCRGREKCRPHCYHRECLHGLVSAISCMLVHCPPHTASASFVSHIMRCLSYQPSPHFLRCYQTHATPQVIRSDTSSLKPSFIRSIYGPHFIRCCHVYHRRMIYDLALVRSRCGPYFIRCCHILPSSHVIRSRLDPCVDCTSYVVFC
jgi:hypothetical protein